MANFFYLAAGLFALGCDDYIFAGLLPGIASSFRSSIAGVAQGISIYGVTFVGALPVCVYLLTKKSTEKVLLLALAVFVAGNLMTLLSPSLGIYILGRAVVGVGAGLFLPLAIATAGGLVDDKMKGRALSFAWGANVAGAVVGIPAGLWLAEKTNWRMSVGFILFMSMVAFVGLVSRNLNLKAFAPPTLREQVGLLGDRGVMSVVGITFVIATSGLGLYVYTTSILAGSVTSPTHALSLWNVGGLIGSVTVGYFLDRMRNQQTLMLMILSTLVGVFLLIPVLRSIPFFGLLPFAFWGALGWSTVTPQQFRLNQLKPGNEAILVALNSSAASLGCVFGTALGGLALARGLRAKDLPYAAAGLLFCALIWQILLIYRQRKSAH